jgi:hypothetical protein
VRIHEIHVVGEASGDRWFASRFGIFMEDLLDRAQTSLSSGNPELKSASSETETLAENPDASSINATGNSSPVNCFVNILCGLIAYCHQLKKPGIAMDKNLLSSAQPELTLFRLMT